MKFLGDLKLFDDIRLLFDLPYSSQSGMLGSVHGLGDLSLLLSYPIIKGQDSKLSIQGGVKLVTANVNSRNLPQSYQSGLGTNDVLLGINYSFDNFLLSAAYQISRGRSKNEFDRLKRGDDIMFRGGYFNSSGEIKYSAELIALKRIHLSSVVDPINPSHFIDFPGSDQFQIDLMTKMSYPIFSNFNLEAAFAIPFLERKINVDGLTRAFTISIGGFYSFAY